MTWKEQKDLSESEEEILHKTRKLTAYNFFFVYLTDYKWNGNEAIIKRYHKKLITIRFLKLRLIKGYSIIIGVVVIFYSFFDIIYFLLI